MIRTNWHMLLNKAISPAVGPHGLSMKGADVTTGVHRGGDRRGHLLTRPSRAWPGPAPWVVPCRRGRTAVVRSAGAEAAASGVGGRGEPWSAARATCRVAGPWSATVDRACLAWSPCPPLGRTTVCGWPGRRSIAPSRVAWLAAGTPPSPQEPVG